MRPAQFIDKGELQGSVSSCAACGADTSVGHGTADVTLTDAGGAELESGAAVLGGTRRRYDAQAAVASGRT